MGANADIIRKRQPSRQMSRKRSMTKKVLDSRRELELSRDQRMEADRNSRNADNVQKFIGKIPEKALRSTFMIRDDEVQIASNQGTVDSVYNNAAGSVSGNVMS